MNPQLCKFILRLFGIALLVACTPQSILNTPTSPPATAAPTMPTLAPTATVDPLPIIALVTQLPTIAIPTISGDSPFEFVATLDEILPGSQTARFRPASDGSVWMITNRGIARLSDSGWTVYLSNYEGHFAGINTLGRAWFINPSMDYMGPGVGASTSNPHMDSISAWDGTKWTKYSSESGWTSFYVDGPSFGFSMAELHGQIWISTRQDLRLLNGSSWRVIKPEEMGLTPPLSSFSGSILC